MSDNLQQKTVRALSWSFLESVARLGVQFLVGIVLARLLFPEQYGLLGMLVIFMAVIWAFLDGGFGAALIQKQDATQVDMSSIFYFNIVVGFAAAGLLCLAAPWIAAFYKQPILVPLTRALSLTIVINSFSMIQENLLTKQINFKTKTRVSLIAGVVSGVAGVALAALGYGVWSLVVQQVAAAIVTTVCLWTLNSWRPSLVFRFAALRQMFGFGSRMLFSSVLNQVFDNIYLVVIGRLFSAADLGFYTRAKTLNDLPSQTLSQVVGRVTFPVFSTIQNDLDRMKRGLKKSLDMLAFVNFPIMIGLVVIAHPLVLVLLTDRWSPSVPYLQLLCIAGLLYPMQLMNLNVLKSLGRSDIFLRLEIGKKVLIAISVALTWRWGITALIYGMIALSIIFFFLNSYYGGVLINYPIKEQVIDLSPYLFASLLMGAAVHAVGSLPFASPWTLLIAQIVLGFSVYAGLCRVFRLKAFMEIGEIIRIRINTRPVDFLNHQDSRDAQTLPKTTGLAKIVSTLFR